jgi:hypothetical protein
MKSYHLFLLRDRIAQYILNFWGGYKEAFNLVCNYPERFQSKTFGGKTLSLTKIAAIPFSMILTSEASLTTQILGVIMLAVSFTIGRMKNNKHQNALSAPLAYTIAMQTYLLGAQGYAIMAGIAGTRGLVMSMLPDTKEAQLLRNRLAFGFAVIGIIAVGATVFFISLWNLLPVGSMLLGTIASSKINDDSYLARPLYMIASANNAIYSAFYSGSAAATILDISGVVNIGKTITENDIPHIKLSGERLCKKERALSYFSTLFSKKMRFEYLYAEDIRKNTDFSARNTT